MHLRAYLYVMAAISSLPIQGVQGESPSLGKSVLLMRDVAEGTESIDAGTAKLVGTTAERTV